MESKLASLPSSGALGIVLLAALTLAAARPLPPCAGAEPQNDGTPVATVGDTELTTVDLERMIRKRTLGRAVSPEQQRQVRAQAVRDLVDETLLRAEIRRRRVEVETAEVNDRIATISKDLSARRSSVDEYRSQAGLDQAAFRRQVEFDLAVPKLVVPLIDAAVMKKVSDDHRRDFDGTRIRVSHIVLRADPGSGSDVMTALLARAEKLRREILSGETTFAAAAERHSAGPSRRQGGDIGFIPRHGLFAEEFARRAFDLAKGEISRPFVTPFGVHIATVTEIDEGKADPEKLRIQLSQIAYQTVLEGLINQCRQRTEITLAPGIEIAEQRTAPQPAGAP